MTLSRLLSWRRRPSTSTAVRSISLSDKRTHLSSRRSSGDRSGRGPRYDGCRSLPWAVRPSACTSTTTSGRTHLVPSASIAGTSSANGDEVPAIDALGTRWVRPEVVVDVQALGRTAQGRLRQPSYRGPRPDLSPDDLRDER